MNLRDVMQTTVADFEAGNAVTWVSPPGFGKTEKFMRVVDWARHRDQACRC